MKLGFWMLLACLLFTPIFADTQGAYYTDILTPVSTPTENIAYMRKAEGSVTSLLGLFAFGDASTDSLMKKANIRSVRYIQKRTTSFLLLFTTDTYTVYGE
ncbi:MAG: TRL domain-containing protein [Candidatus Margulisiibacteriota bacterium]